MELEPQRGDGGDRILRLFAAMQLAPLAACQRTTSKYGAGSVTHVPGTSVTHVPVQTSQGNGGGNGKRGQGETGNGVRVQIIDKINDALIRSGSNTSKRYKVSFPALLTLWPTPSSLTQNQVTKSRPPKKQSLRPSQATRFSLTSPGSPPHPKPAPPSARLPSIEIGFCDEVLHIRAGRVIRG